MCAVVVCLNSVTFWVMRIGVEGVEVGAYPLDWCEVLVIVSTYIDNTAC